ncbi:MAG: hypothetical protein ACLQQ4_13375 [Bacteroidia bacterium]
MAIIIKTNNPTELLSAIRKAIDEKAISTWSYDADGDFTHTGQWKSQAWFRPKIYQNELRFGLLGPKDTTMTSLLYGIFHGRFTEMLLIHFDSKISSINPTVYKTEPDFFN